MIPIQWRTIRAILEQGTNSQVFKTGLAAGMSWFVAQSVFGTPRPYFAPLAAILSLQVTVAESIARGVQRVVGVAAGILVAVGAGYFFHLTAWSVGLVVYGAVFLASRLHMGAQGIPQVAITALLVMTVGRMAPQYAWIRALDTAVGVIVAIGINALIWPPDATPAAEHALTILNQDVCDVLSAIRQDLISGLDSTHARHHLSHARRLDQALEDVKQAIRQAEKSLKWNVMAKRRRQRLKTLRQAATVLEHALTQVRGIARSLFVTVERNVDHPYASLPKAIATGLGDLLALMSQALKTYSRIIIRRDPHAAWQMERTLKQASHLRHLLAQNVQYAEVDWLDLAAVLADVEKMTQDLLVSSRLLIPLVIPAEQELERP
ncbi:MAG: FUSC family protein [Sulfobacillus thermosulfidooxidans]|uniref:FUSC family protein n=1 Tax=Sulfobacillus TaxID=28033 RepID=UPI000CD0E7B1|nr:aromatic acid exporter family protein [Sulfobacillus sp. hq2]POB11473.1 FUSC family protein [Sulfobacillus sp. hq2]PSR38043.1 MAG: FUSC family protein [Sulfobacillus thermosulfidooxidans]